MAMFTPDVPRDEDGYEEPPAPFTFEELDTLRGGLFAHRRELAGKLQRFAKQPAGRNWRARERDEDAIRFELGRIEQLLVRTREMQQWMVWAAARRDTAS